MAATGAFGVVALPSKGEADPASSADEPVLRLGVISDIHITDDASCSDFRKVLRLFDSRRADAVLCTGDLADHGLVSQLKRVAATWNEVFPQMRRSDGGRIERLFHYGDHDTYLNFKARKRFVYDQGLGSEFIPDVGPGKVWEEVFGEKYAHIVHRRLKGYDFVLSHFRRGPANVNPAGNNVPGLERFLEKLDLPKDKPFFYLQHRIYNGTIERAGCDDRRGWDDGTTTAILAKYPNCIALCGHGHIPATNETSLWRGAFTAIEVPSLFYSLETWLPKVRTDDDKHQALWMRVYRDCIVIERLDVTTGKKLADDWTVSLAAGASAAEASSGEPLLAAPSERAVAVSWAVPTLATGGVEIGEKPDLSDARYVKSGEMPLADLDDKSLMARLDGLRPATRYYYRTVTQEVVSARNPHAARIKAGRRIEGKVHSFTTPGADAASRFAVINDTHANWKAFACVTAHLRASRPPVVVWNGDALNCTEEKATAVKTFLSPDVPAADYAAEAPLLFLPGNHDFEGQYARHIDEVIPCRPADEHEGRFAALKWNFAVRQGEIALVGLDTGEGIHDDDLRLCGLGSFSAYRRLQTAWLEAALARPEIASAPFVVAFCHIPLYNSGPNPNGCEKPLPKGCASWLRECNEAWGPVLDRHRVQLVVCGHEHLHRWDDRVPGHNWAQVLGGGPEMGYGAGFVKDDRYCPTVIEGAVADGRLVVTAHDVWRNKVLSTRTFERRKRT